MRRNLSPCLGRLMTCLILLLYVLPVQAQKSLYNPDKWELLVKDKSYNNPDSLCSYTLFTGTGNWDDAARWSHQPPHIKASAWVNGHVVITEDISCTWIYLGKGSISVAPGCKLTVKYLFLCDPTASIRASGNVEVSHNAVIRYILPEKGKWFFLAAPFDIDRVQEKTHTFQDDKISASGNYFYMRTYNGERRGTFGQPSGNWEVVPVSPTKQPPFFEEGKGYLFALDAGADHTEILFSSKYLVNLTNFGQRGTVDIQVSIPEGKASSPHHGWFLCGNPLPSPFPLSAIEPNPDLDGNVYVYEAGAYKAYPIGSEHIIPLAGTFFVKARKSTTLVISPSAPVN